MRRFAFFTLFFLACLSLFGQTPKEYNIYILPIAGYGREKDNDYFYKQLAYEVIVQYHTVVESQGSCNYIFKGTIEPVIGLPNTELVPESAKKKDNYGIISENAEPPVRNIFGRREFFSIENDNEIYFFDSTGNLRIVPLDKIQTNNEGYYFKLEMIDVKTGETLGRQTILFFVTDASVSKLVSIIVYNLLSNIPNSSKRGDSRDRWMYFETSILWMPRIYYGGYEKINLLNLGMKMGIELRFLRFMSLGAGAQVTQDQIIAFPDSFTDLVLEVPASLKLVFKLGGNYALEPYGGASWNYSLGKKIQPSKYSYFAGVQFGIKDRSETGMFVIDPRFSMDLYDSVISGSNIEYKRYCFQLGLGYKFGAIQKRSTVK